MLCSKNVRHNNDIHSFMIHEFKILACVIFIYNFIYSLCHSANAKAKDSI